MTTLADLSSAPAFKLGALRIRSLAVPSRGSKELATWRVDLPPSGASGQHSIDREQVIIVNAGAVTAMIDGTITVAQAGDALILPISTTLELRNDGTTEASATVISAIGFKATAGGHTFTPPWAL